MDSSRMTKVVLFIFLSIFNSQLGLGVLSLQTKPSQDFSYMKIVQNAATLPAKEEYDYIIIGGGTAGCPLAATLSSNSSVLILERGSDPKAHPFVLTQQGLGNTLSDQDDGTNSTPFQRFTSEDGVENIRGRILGGGSMINVGFYSRAQTEFFEQSGVKWDMKMVEKAYQWVEETVVSRPVLSPWQSTFRKVLLEGGVGPDNGFHLNHLIGTRTGGSIFDSQGNRNGAVEFLNKANPFNLKIATHATVRRIIFSNSSHGLSASGVLYSDANGRLHRAVIRNKGEVILSAGAIGSPQLLLLSGVGSKSYLSSLKLPVVLHQPHVGQFMADNPRYGVHLVLPFIMPPTSVQVVGTFGNNIHIESLSTVLPFSIPTLFGLLPPQSQSSSVNMSTATFAGKFSDVVSTGSLRLASTTDVGKNPIVRFNYLSHPDDVARCVRGVRKVVDLLNTKTMDGLKTRDLQGIKGFQFLGPPLPGNMSDDGLVGEFCRKTVTTFWHYHGGCVVGKVVDENYRVIGIKNLRVVDGSTFSLSPGTNPMATVMMLGRYVGLQLLQQRTQ